MSAWAEVARRCTRGHELPDSGKRGCDECRRENLARMPPPGPKPTAATAPRRCRRRSDAFLSRRQVLAAHELYLAGMSSYDLADLGWRKWGYASPDIARRKLLEAFKRDGLTTRTRSEALTHRHAKEKLRQGRPHHLAGSADGLDRREHTDG